MKQTTRALVTVLALLLVAVAIGLAAVWAGKDAEKKAEQKEKSEKLFDFDKARVRSLRLERPAGKLVAALERKDANAGWDLTAPVKAEGDDVAVNALVDSLASLKQKKDLGDEKDGKPYGFDAPSIVISVKTDDGKESRLEVGADNPFDNTAYVRKGGDSTLRVVDASAKAPFAKELFDLRDKSITHLDSAAEVKRIDVTGSRTPYTLEKEGAAWKLLSPAGLADAATADRLASSLKGLRATAVAAESAPVPATFGLAPPKITVRLGVGTAGGKDTLTRTLQFGEVRAAATAKTYVKREDSATVFEVDGAILKDLDKDLFDLQDKQLTHASREDVRKIVLESPGAQRIEIARTKDTAADGGTAEESFNVVAPQKGPAKKWKLSSALYTLTGLRAATLVDKPRKPADLAKLGLDKPRTVTLLGDGDKVLARFSVGSETKEHRRNVLVDGMARVAQVEKGSVDDLPWTLTDALEAPPPPPAASDAGVAAAKH